MNYGIAQHTKNILFDEKIGGTLHVALGSGYPETGSTNTSGLHWDMVLDLRKNGTVLADDELIVRNGSFVV
jgi:aminopeptidase